jgi:hypothetical protein
MGGAPGFWVRELHLSALSAGPNGYRAASFLRQHPAEQQCVSVQNMEARAVDCYLDVLKSNVILDMDGSVPDSISLGAQYRRVTQPIVTDSARADHWGRQDYLTVATVRACDRHRPPVGRKQCSD